jgi:amidohydrolase
MVPTLSRLLGEDHVHNLDPIMAAEDFAYFARIVPGFYFRLGTTKPGTTSGWNHTPDFMADDASVPVGMRAMSSLVLDYLRAHAEAGAGTSGGAP